MYIGNIKTKHCITSLNTSVLKSDDLGMVYYTLYSMSLQMHGK